MAVYVVPLKLVRWELQFVEGHRCGWSREALNYGCYAMFERVA